MLSLLCVWLTSGTIKIKTDRKPRFLLKNWQKLTAYTNMETVTTFATAVISCNWSLFYCHHNWSLIQWFFQRGKAAPTNRGYDPSRVVHLRNLPEDIDMDDVMELGRPFGPVISALRIKDTQVPYLVCRCIVDSVARWRSWLERWTCDWRLRVQSQQLHCWVRPWTSCSHTLSSASEVMTLWRYINQFK